MTHCILSRFCETLDFYVACKACFAGDTCIPRNAATIFLEVKYIDLMPLEKKKYMLSCIHIQSHPESMKFRGPHLLFHIMRVSYYLGSVRGQFLNLVDNLSTL